MWSFFLINENTACNKQTGYKKETNRKEGESSYEIGVIMNNDKIIKNEKIEDEIFSDYKISEIHNSIFINCIFKKISFKDSSITKSIFEGCTFENCTFDFALINDVSYVLNSLKSTSFKDSIIFKGYFKENIFEYVVFDKAIVYESYFRGNDINKSSFSETRFGFEFEDRKRFPVSEQTEFIENKLNNTRFLKSFARGCDFLSNEFYKCQIHEMDISYGSIDYCKFVNTVMKYLVRDYTSNQGVDAIITPPQSKERGE